MTSQSHCIIHALGEEQTGNSDSSLVFLPQGQQQHRRQKRPSFGKRRVPQQQQVSGWAKPFPHEGQEKEETSITTDPEESWAGFSSEISLNPAEDGDHYYFPRPAPLTNHNGSNSMLSSTKTTKGKRSLSTTKTRSMSKQRAAQAASNKAEAVESSPAAQPHLQLKQQPRPSRSTQQQQSQQMQQRRPCSSSKSPHKRRSSGSTCTTSTRSTGSNSSSNLSSNPENRNMISSGQSSSPQQQQQQRRLSSSSQSPSKRRSSGSTGPSSAATTGSSSNIEFGTATPNDFSFSSIRQQRRLSSSSKSPSKRRSSGSTAPSSVSLNTESSSNIEIGTINQNNCSSPSSRQQQRCPSSSSKSPSKRRNSGSTGPSSNIEIGTTVQNDFSSPSSRQQPRRPSSSSKSPSKRRSSGSTGPSSVPLNTESSSNFEIGTIDQNNCSSPSSRQQQRRPSSSSKSPSKRRSSGSTCTTSTTTGSSSSGGSWVNTEHSTSPVTQSNRSSSSLHRRLTRGAGRSLSPGIQNKPNSGTPPPSSSQHSTRRRASPSPNTKRLMKSSNGSSSTPQQPSCFAAAFDYVPAFAFDSVAASVEENDFSPQGSALTSRELLLDHVLSNSDHYNTGMNNTLPVPSDENATSTNRSSASPSCHRSRSSCGTAATATTVTSTTCDFDSGSSNHNFQHQPHQPPLQTMVRSSSSRSVNATKRSGSSRNVLAGSEHAGLLGPVLTTTSSDQDNNLNSKTKQKKRRKKPVSISTPASPSEATPGTGTLTTSSNGSTPRQKERKIVNTGNSSCRSTRSTVPLSTPLQRQKSANLNKRSAGSNNHNLMQRSNSAARLLVNQQEQGFNVATSTTNPSQKSCSMRTSRSCLSFQQLPQQQPERTSFHPRSSSGIPRLQLQRSNSEVQLAQGTAASPPTVPWSSGVIPASAFGRQAVALGSSCRSTCSSAPFLPQSEANTLLKKSTSSSNMLRRTHSEVHLSQASNAMSLFDEPSFDEPSFEPQLLGRGTSTESAAGCSSRSSSPSRSPALERRLLLRSQGSKQLLVDEDDEEEEEEDPSLLPQLSPDHTGITSPTVNAALSGSAYQLQAASIQRSASENQLQNILSPSTRSRHERKKSLTKKAILEVKAAAGPAPQLQSTTYEVQPEKDPQDEEDCFFILSDPVVDDDYDDDDDDNDPDLSLAFGSESEHDRRVGSDERRLKRQARVERIKENIRIKQHRVGKQDETEKDRFVMSEDQRRLLAYQWYLQHDRPTKSKMLQLVKNSQALAPPGGIFVAQSDVDLLPWVYEGGLLAVDEAVVKQMLQ